LILLSTLALLAGGATSNALCLGSEGGNQMLEKQLCLKIIIKSN
jgi:hypothetical protein